jgi:hypothetical protein
VHLIFSDTSPLQDFASRTRSKREVCGANFAFAMLTDDGPAVTHFVFAGQTSRMHRKPGACRACWSMRNKLGLFIRLLQQRRRFRWSVSSPQVRCECRFPWCSDRGGRGVVARDECWRRHAEDESRSSDERCGLRLLHRPAKRSHGYGRRSFDTRVGGL